MLLGGSVQAQYGLLYRFLTFVCVDFMGQATRNKVWNLEYTRNCFFPFWRSVLLSHIRVVLYPDYAAADPKCRLNHDKQRQKSADKGSSPTIPSHIRAMLGRTLQISNDHASARLFSTAALGMRPQATPNHTSRRLFGTTALTLLKVLKKA